MLKDLQIHICVQTFRKITDLKHMLVNVLLPHLSSSLWLVLELIPNYVFHCISLHCISNVQWVPRCSENKLELWKSELQCDVSSIFGNGLTLCQLWLAFTKVPKCLTKTIKTLATTWQPFLFKGNFIYSFFQQLLQRLI